MSKRKNSKFRFDRRIGESLWDNPRSSALVCSNPPGQHGAKIKTKTSDYCTRMLAKQKLKFYYSNLTESKLKKAYKKALSYKGNAACNLVMFLECRLDVLVYRANLAVSLIAARQLVSHGHILVNNIRVTICSYRCKRGDVFRVAPKSVHLCLIREAVFLRGLLTPGHILANYRHLVFVLVDLPDAYNVGYSSAMCLDLVMEYYQGMR
ncbi:30S ribosomal protein S4 [Candidatus Hodgkinia cicadicola]